MMNSDDEKMNDFLVFFLVFRSLKILLLEFDFCDAVHYTVILISAGANREFRLYKP